MHRSPLDESDPMTHLSLALAVALGFANTPTLDVRVEGLRADESFTVLAPGPGPTEDFAHGRVIDAFTGAPLPGATIELWSEEIDEHYGGFHRFGVATSGRDGRFMVRRRDGARTAEKLRASAPGYLVYTETAAQAHGVIMLFPAEEHAPRLRLVDLQGRPIQGARVTSTFTCAHDIPAFEYVSDIDGVVVLEGYGLQDSIPELRVLAPGFRAIKYLSGEPILIAASRGEAYTERLRRTPGFEGEVIDTTGSPLANSLFMVNDGDGYHVTRTDDAGVLRIPARYDAYDLELSPLEPTSDATGYAEWKGGPYSRLRFNAHSWPAEVETGFVKPTQDGSPMDRWTSLTAVHMDGWEPRAGDGFFELPVGEFAYFVDGPDGSWDVLGPRVWTIATVRAGETTEIDFPAPRSAETIELPEDLWSEVVLEIGERSVALGSDMPRTEPGVRYTLYFSGCDLCVERDQPMRPEDVDELRALLEAACAADEPIAPATIQVSIRSGVECFVTSPCLDGFPGPDEHGSMTAPAGTPILLTWTAPGHAAVYGRTRLEHGMSLSTPMLPKLAALRVESSQAVVIEGFEDSEDLDGLHPGPFECVARLASGERIGLRLDLEPGAARVLRIE